MLMLEHFRWTSCHVRDAGGTSCQLAGFILENNDPPASRPFSHPLTGLVAYSGAHLATRYFCRCDLMVNVDGAPSFSQFISAKMDRGLAATKPRVLTASSKLRCNSVVHTWTDDQK